MSTSPLTNTFPLKSILKKENHLIKGVQNSETKTGVKTNKSFQKKVFNSFKKLSLKKTSNKKSTSLDLKPSINIEKKPQKKVIFELDKLKEGNYLKMKPALPTVLTHKMLQEKSQLLAKKQERHFKGDHSYYQSMGSLEEGYLKIWECT
ncbi:hypothetical protein [Candidatus Rhabdochlamydia porcellionis]|jgi:hypothetical protein|uniref:Uncharacterized protein n=1 Tax=Candidatus Rhabdochlamydia porcellionis TaxID=225148 RepID=A0ABX8Z480_9BACT|nr:hypothetical protein [Candidatus Rhabdochlamydia porcellionis]QZA58882.1 hypothetical protein RHAB15C_0000763 [Candidatus Rhabdochlamydia porcellionis]